MYPPLPSLFKVLTKRLVMLIEIFLKNAALCEMVYLVFSITIYTTANMLDTFLVTFSLKLS
jgi:hypothetical protein